MNRRINITLPESTLLLLDKITNKGDRSRFIDRALKHYLASAGKEKLKAQLKEGYTRRSDESLEIAAEWFEVDEETWQNNDL